MGEYGRRRSDGVQVKIGTCNEMLYLRADQVGQVDAKTLLRGTEGLLFRFPFPDEDLVLPGDFDDSDRTVGLHDVLPPVGVEHRRVQFTSTHPKGHLIMLPCPFSLQAESLGFKYQRNGFGQGAVRIKYQKSMNGLLMLVAACGGCNAMYRMETLADAAALVEACKRRATYERSADAPRAKWWNTVAERIEAGYFKAAS